MISFKQFLNEEWHALMPSPYKTMPGNVDIFKNPTRKELSEVINNSEAKSARGIFHGNDVYVFDAMKAIHADARDHLSLPSRNPDFFTVRKDRWGSEYVNSDETLHRNLNHPWVKKTIPNHRFFHG